MQPKARKLLEDIRDSASFILQQAGATSVQDYKSSRLLRQAVERNFEIIGEAVGRLRKIDPEIARHVSNAHHIVAFRNVLIHGYHLIDDAEVWRVIVESLPVLLREAEALLSSDSG